MSLAASALFMSAAAAAQIVTPPTIRPPTREEVGQAQPRRQADIARLQDITEGIERAPCAFGDPRFASVSFVLNEVRFNGLQSIPADLVSPAYADRVGKTIGVAELCEIRDRAATILRRAGYVAAVQIPDQRIEQGAATFDVLVAKLVRIEFADGKGDPLIARLLGKLQANELFNLNQAQRYLLLARDLPGYDVRLTLRPAGTVPGEVIGVVAVTRTPVTGGITLHNLGSRQVGRVGGLASVQFNGLTGAGSQTSLGLFATSDPREQKIFQLGHALRVGGEGLLLSLDGSYAITKPDSRPRIPLRAETLVLTAQGSYPLLRSEAKNVYLSAGLDIIDQDVDFARLRLTSDRLRVGMVRLDVDRIDPRATSTWSGPGLGAPRWRVAMRLEARQGLGIGASERCRNGQVCELSRVDGDPTAFVLRGNAQIEVRPVPRLVLSLSPSFQFAPNPLLAYEEFSVGNFTVGRGYDPGALTGDSGIGLRGEIALADTPIDPSARLAVQPYAFVDHGTVWNRFRGPDLRQDLTSVGGGLRATLPGRARLDVSLAAPLKRAPLENDRDLRLLVTLSTNLIPWSR